MWQAHSQLLDPANYAGLESGLTWLGVAGLIDPPRPEVKGAIEDCVRAGIRVRPILRDDAYRLTYKSSFRRNIFVQQ